MVLSRQRQIVACNRELLAMLSASRAQRVGRSFEVLHQSPSAAEFQRTGERIVASLDKHGRRAGACQQAAAWMNARTRLHAARRCPGSLKAFALPHIEAVWAWMISHRTPGRGTPAGCGLRFFPSRPRVNGGEPHFAGPRSACQRL
jgi:hypothetical protein